MPAPSAITGVSEDRSHDRSHSAVDQSHSAVDRSQARIHSAVDWSQARIHSAVDRSRAWIHSVVDRSRARIHSAVDRSQARIHSAVDWSQARIHSAVDRSRAAGAAVASCPLCSACSGRRGACVSRWLGAACPAVGRWPLLDGAGRLWAVPRRAHEDTLNTLP